MRRWAVPIAVVSAAVVCGEASALAPVQTPGLQVALYRHGFYRGAVDGIPGPLTRQAVVEFQRAKGLPADGVVGKQTLAALGPLGRPLFGSRMLMRGAVGFDVSVLQFLLARRGFPTESLNSNFGTVTEQRVREFQRRVGLPADGVVGPATRAALSRGSVPATADAAARRHVVRPGETLSGIADRYRTTVGAIARRNRIDPQALLVAGRTLLVPEARTTARRR